MRAVGVLPGEKEVRLIEQEAIEIERPEQVKVRSLEVGVCGTDREICTFQYGSPPLGCPYLVLGHESLGEVVEVGTGVSKVKPGDLVVPSVRRPCPHPHCRPCRSGRQDFCVTGDFTERGIKMRHGYMTPFYVEAEQYLTRVPPELREVGVLTEPLTVAEKAITQIWEIQSRLPWRVSEDPGQAGKGLRAVVLGAGPVGLLGAMAFVVRGFETVVYSRAAKPNRKAEFLESIGVPYVSSKETSPQGLVQQIGPIDLVYEAAGAAEPAFQLLEVLARNGIFVFTGIPAPQAPASFDLATLMRRLVLRNQVAVGSVNADVQDFQRAVDDLGRFRQRWPQQLQHVITSRHSLASFKEPLLGRDKGIKSVITFT